MTPTTFPNAPSDALAELARVADDLFSLVGSLSDDDLRAPEVAADAASGWAVLPGYGQAQALPEGVAALSAHVKVPPVLARRIGQIGLVDRAEGARLQPLLKPGQRLVMFPDEPVWSNDPAKRAALGWKLECERATERDEAKGDQYACVFRRYRRTSAGAAEGKGAAGR
mgnify:CR=1 FL=1